MQTLDLWHGLILLGILGVLGGIIGLVLWLVLRGLKR